MNISLSINKDNYFCLKFRIHKVLIPFFNKKVISKSFSTKDKNLAQLKATQLYGSYLKILNSVSVVDTNQLQEMTNTFIEQQLNQKLQKDSTTYFSKYNKHSTITFNLAYEKFFTWYQTQNVSKTQLQVVNRTFERILLPYFGHKTDIKDITIENINGLKKILTRIPVLNYKKYKYLTFNQLLNLKNIPSNDLISVSSQARYLSHLKQFFSYLIKANLIEYNPCLLLTMPSIIYNNREPFTKDDITKLAFIFTELDDRKYIYYTLLYTGMRPGEFWKCKISTSDDGVIYFDLTEENIKLKTLSSKRTIPLHNNLLDVGIHTKLKSLQSTFNREQISRYFNDILMPRISDNPNKVMYSFRHTVANTLKRAEVNMDKISELLGHRYSNSSITKEVYTQRYTLRQLRKAINKLDY